MKYTLNAIVHDVTAFNYLMNENFGVRSRYLGHISNFSMANLDMYERYFFSLPKTASGTCTAVGNC